MDGAEALGEVDRRLERMADGEREVVDPADARDRRDRARAERGLDGLLVRRVDQHDRLDPGREVARFADARERERVAFAAAELDDEQVRRRVRIVSMAASALVCRASVTISPRSSTPLTISSTKGRVSSTTAVRCRSCVPAPRWGRVRFSSSMMAIGRHDSFR